ncbi:MAG: 50S ribosomal protein L21 [Bacteroidetes bacterium]|nr:50S ribosomal protein L21 [Bacteroidota bacterium]
MYAIVDIAGQQFKVEKDQQIFVHRLAGEVGSAVDFEKVMLIESNGKVDLGTPFISGATVSAKIISHMKSDKVIVFHKKRRKGYQKSNGHRQYMTKISIESIGDKIVAKPKKAKTEKVETTEE